LKSQLEQAVKEANELKETLENEMKDKEVKTRRIEEELRTDIRVKMEEIVRAILNRPSLIKSFS
jgi:hypothetical protein